MTFLPIVARELRVASRRRSTFYFRFIVALLGLIVLLWIMIIPGMNTPQNLGPVVFTGVSITAFVYAMLIGIFTTSDSLSEEKREGTMGLLFLTDLKGYDVVFGKLVATSISAVYGLFALFPVLAIPLLAGGVTAGEITRVVIVMLNSVFFSLAVGMFISAVTRDERRAMGFTLCLLVFITGGVPLMGALLTNWSYAGAEMSPVFYLLSPAFSCFTAFDAIYRTIPKLQQQMFYWSLGIIHGMGWLGLATACWIVPRSWQEKTSGTGRGGDRWQQLRFGHPQARLALKRRLLQRNPIRWLTSRDQLKSILVWAFLAFAALIWFWGLAAEQNEWLNGFCYVTTGLVLNTILKLWLALEACKQFGQDRKSGALELVLSTPLSVRKMVDGQIMGLWKQFAGPVAVILGVEFFFLMGVAEEKDWVFAFVSGMIVLVADLVALSWTGMWLGLNSRSLHRAAAAAVVRVMVLPWVLMGIACTAVLLCMAFDSSSFLRQLIETWEARFFIGMWLILSLAVDVCFLSWARNRLLANFREVATRTYDTRRSWFRRGQAQMP